MLYLDGTCEFGDRTFGVNADGEANALGLAAGGNILCGDIFHPFFGEGDPIDGTQATSYNFIMEELGIFNRMEWMKTEETLPGAGYEATVPRTEWVPGGDYYYKEEITYEKNIYEYTDYSKTLVGTETVTGTTWVWFDDIDLVPADAPIYEWRDTVYTNPYYQGPDYLPRYYGFTEGSEIPIYDLDGYFDPVAGVWQADERAGKYGEWDLGDISVLDPTDLSEERLYHEDGTPRAAISTLTGTGGWIADELLRDLIVGRLAERDATTDLEIDAVLYSSNSIFGILPVEGGVGSNGRAIVNGAIVAADVGLLAPVGFRLNYDARAKDLVDLNAVSRLTVRRMFIVPTVDTGAP